MEANERFFDPDEDESLESRESLWEEAAFGGVSQAKRPFKKLEPDALRAPSSPVFRTPRTS